MLWRQTRFLCATVAAALACPSNAPAQSPEQPVPVMVQPLQSVQVADEVTRDDAIAPGRYESSELPASITGDNELLPLAPDGPAALPALPVRSWGCSPQPLIRCLGPDYCGCSPRLYYGTNPRDDDPVLPMSPRINDPKTKHWYQHALDMVGRKKRVAEAIH